jgi:DNA-binding PadR family transcriptional regulator
MPAARKVKNLTALAVLATVYQRPMHRYEIAMVMKAHGKDRDMDVKWGSLYTVVQSLEKHHLLEAVETNRQGARPERTIYRITDAGVEEMLDWTRELLLVSEREHPRFVAGLSLLMVLPPATVIELLTQRLQSIRTAIEAQTAALAHNLEDVPRLFLVEDEYAIAIAEAEAAWVAALLRELVDGTFPGLGDWAEVHRTGVFSPELAELAERGVEPDEHETEEHGRQQ